MQISDHAIVLYVSWINGDRKYVLDQIAASGKKMILMAEICLKFQANNDPDLRHFLSHVAKCA